MKKRTRFTILAILFNLSLFTYANGLQESNGGPGGSGGPGGPGGSGGPGAGGSGGSGDSRQEMPMPSESELTVVRLQNLAETEQESLAINEEQAEMIIPILEEWMEAVSENPNSNSDDYITRISAELTDEQNDFIPPPPGQMGGPQGGEKNNQGGRPSEDSRPAEIEISELLPEVITALKKV